MSVMACTCASCHPTTVQISSDPLPVATPWLRVMMWPFPAQHPRQGLAVDSNTSFFAGASCFAALVQPIQPYHQTPPRLCGHTLPLRVSIFVAVQVAEVTMKATISILLALFAAAAIAAEVEPLAEPFSADEPVVTGEPLTFSLRVLSCGSSRMGH